MLSTFGRDEAIRLRDIVTRGRHVVPWFAAAWAFWLIALSGQVEGAGKDPARAIPDELVGKWGFAVAIGEYCTDFAHCAPGSGGSTSFEFTRNGRADHALFESTLADGCGEIRALTLKTGRITVSGGAIFFTPTAGTYKSLNACRPDLTGTWKFGPNDLKPVTFQWRFEGEGLRIADPSGEASGLYSRRR